MKIVVFWAVTQYSQIKFNRHFQGHNRFDVQGRKVKLETCMKQAPSEESRLASGMYVVAVPVATALKQMTVTNQNHWGMAIPSCICLHGCGPTWAQCG
jgi:hypothetical protein